MKLRVRKNFLLSHSQREKENGIRGGEEESARGTSGEDGMKEKMKKKRKENKNGRKKKRKHNQETDKKKKEHSQQTTSLPPLPPPAYFKTRQKHLPVGERRGRTQAKSGTQPPLALASAQFYHYISKYLSCTPSPDLRARRRPGVAPIALPARRNSLGVPSFCCLFCFLFRSFLLLLSPFVDFSLVSCVLFSLGFI